jgi:hypothetical protein
MDFDGDVDLHDMSAFTACFGSQGVSFTGCSCADYDGDAVVDLGDWGSFATEITGPQ